jgi:hypothetical protein
MKKTIIPMLFIDLQLFAEGGGTGADGVSGVTGTAAVSQTGESSVEVKYGKQNTVPSSEAEVTTEATLSREEEFAKIRKGEYKDLFDAEVQNTVQKRLKSTKDTVQKYEALTPTLELLAKKYGVDAADIEALNRAIEDDDSYFEEEALEKGISVKQLKEIRKMERENAELRREMQARQNQENANREYARWIGQAEEAKKFYPNIDLRAEMQSEQFRNLLRNGVDVRAAYEVMHRDEIFPAIMRHAAKEAEQKVTNKVIANGARPTENGMSSQSASIVKDDVSQLSNADIDEVIRQVRAGKKITFG